MTVVPSYPSFPPEMVYPWTQHTTEPAACFREMGSSRVAYFSGDIDRTFWLSGNADLSQLLHQTIRWLRGESAPPVTVTGDELVEIFAWETEPACALHLLNYTNPSAMRGPFQRFHPVANEEVEFRAARPIKSVRALPAGQPIAFRQEGSKVSFTVPVVEDYEVISLA